MARPQAGWSAVCGVLIGMVLSAMSLEARGADLPDGGLLDRQWYRFGELGGARDFRAEPHHTVILDLGSTGARGKRIRTSIPYVFLRTAAFKFCVPKDEPHILSLTLIAEGSHAPVVHVRGGHCKTRTIDRGRYSLEIEHDGKRVPANGVTAFIHSPRPGLTATLDTANRTSLAEAPTSVMSSLPACGALGSSFWTSVENPLFMLSIGSDYLQGASYPSSGTVTTLNGSASAGDAFGGWSMCRQSAGAGYLILFNGVNPSQIRQWRIIGKNSPPAVYQDALGPCTTDSSCLFTTSDDGGGDFRLWASAYFGGAPLVYRGGLAPSSCYSSPCYTTFSAIYKAYRAGAHVPPPQTGEVQLLKAACGQSPTGTIVSSTNLPNLDQAGIRISGNVTVSPGPGTVAVAYPGLNYTGTPQYIFSGEDVCLTQLPPSLAITTAVRDIVASTNTCRGCDLSGVDLSGLDLPGGDFTGTVFDGANLTGTGFQSAILDDAQFTSAGGTAKLTGTNFLGAHLNCGSFQKSDVRDALFWSSVAPIRPVIKRDFSCRLLLQSAHLAVDSFPLADWRYLQLDGAAFTGVSGQTLSTLQSPLDLSSARLSGTSGLTDVGLSGANLAGTTFQGTDLTGAVLTGANVSGTDFTGADLTSADLGAVTAATNNPATFNRATLTYAYMKNARLSGSFFRGARMSPVNLGGADLSGAWLEDDGTGQFAPVTLVRAYMANTLLDGAHLTSAVLDLVSWFNDPKASTTAPKASGKNALLNGASFNLADLPQVDLSGAFLQGATLTNTQLIQANLTDAKLGPDQSGHRTNLSTANLRGANLSGANLSSANLTNAGADALPDSQVFLEVLKDPDHFQQPLEYQYFAVNRPATVVTGDTITTANTSCPNTAVLHAPDGSCGPVACNSVGGTVTCPAWVAPVPPAEPSNCQTTTDAQGNIIAVTCTSERHPTGG